MRTFHHVSRRACNVQVPCKSVCSSFHAAVLYSACSCGMHCLHSVKFKAKVHKIVITLPSRYLIGCHTCFKFLCKFTLFYSAIYSQQFENMHVHRNAFSLFLLRLSPPTFHTQTLLCMHICTHT